MLPCLTCLGYSHTVFATSTSARAQILSHAGRLDHGHSFSGPQRLMEPLELFSAMCRVVSS